MSSDVKIQINSADALMRLLGDQTEVQMMVRDNIANEFVTNHIKPLLSDAKYTQFKTEVEKKLDKARDDIVKDILQKPNPWGDDAAAAILSEKIKAQIKEEVDKNIKALLKEYGETKYLELQIKIISLFSQNQAKIELYIQKQITAIISSQVEASLKEMVEHLVEMSAHYKEQTKERKLGDRNISLQL